MTPALIVFVAPVGMGTGALIVAALTYLNIIKSTPRQQMTVALMYFILAIVVFEIGGRG